MKKVIKNLFWWSNALALLVVVLFTALNHTEWSFRIVTDINRVARKTELGWASITSSFNVYFAQGGIQISWEPEDGVNATENPVEPVLIENWWAYFVIGGSPDYPFAFEIPKRRLEMEKVSTHEKLGLQFARWKPTNPNVASGWSFTFPFTPFVILWLLCTLFFFARKKWLRHRQRRRLAKGECLKCGHQLLSNQEICSECGHCQFGVYLEN